MRRTIGIVIVGLTLAAALTLAGAPPAGAELDPVSPRADFVPLSPRRLLETRPGLTTVDGLANGRGSMASGERLALDVAGRAGVPVDAGGVMLDVTVTGAIGPGFLTLWPCDAPQPLASNLNYAAGDTVANLVFVGLSNLGQVCVYAHATTDVVVDVEGYSAAQPALRPSTPERLLDTRPGGVTIDGRFAAGGALAADTALVLELAGRGPRLPHDLVTAVVNVTVTEPVGPGFLTVWSCLGIRPLASNVNFAAGQTIAALVISGVGAGDHLCVSSSVATHVVIDMMGEASAIGGEPLSFLPARLLDTRPATATVDARFAGSGLTEAGGSLELDVRDRGGVPADATAVALTVTATEPTGDGYVTVWPCDQDRPTASNLNHGRGQTIANTVVVRPDPAGRVCLFTQTPTHLVVDVSTAWRPVEAPIAVEDLAWLTLPAGLALATRTIETISPDGRYAVMAGARANGGTYDGVVLVVDRVGRHVHVGPVFTAGYPNAAAVGTTPAVWISDGLVLYGRRFEGFARWAIGDVTPFVYPTDLDECEIEAPPYYVTLPFLRGAVLEARTNCEPGGGPLHGTVYDMSPNGRYLLDLADTHQLPTRLSDVATGTERPVPVVLRDGDLPAACRDVPRTMLLDNGTTGVFVRCGSFAFVRAVTADGFITDRLQPVGPTDELDGRVAQAGWFPSGRGYWWIEGRLGSMTLHVHDLATGVDLAPRAVGDCAFRASGDVIWAVFCP